MDAEELDEQFQAVEFDKSGNIIPPSSPPATARKKRKTVADVDKRIDEITELIDVEIHGWLDQLDTRVRHFENAEAEKSDFSISDIITRLETVERFRSEDLPIVITHTNSRLDALESGIGALADAFRQHIEETQPQEPAAAQEIEFAKPPQEPEPPQTDYAGLEHIASVCLNMTDVLMICRALKATSCMYDSERIYLLSLACGTAGIEETPGLRIRAGIHDSR